MTLLLQLDSTRASSPAAIDADLASTTVKTLLDDENDEPSTGTTIDASNATAIGTGDLAAVNVASPVDQLITVDSTVTQASIVSATAPAAILPIINIPEPSPIAVQPIDIVNAIPPINITLGAPVSLIPPPSNDDQVMIVSPIVSNTPSNLSDMTQYT